MPAKRPEQGGGGEMKIWLLRGDLFKDVPMLFVPMSQSFRECPFCVSVFLLHIPLSSPSVAVADVSWSLDG